MFKRLYAIGAHEDLFSPHAPYQIFAAVWYGEYHTVVQRVPRRGIPTNRKYKKQYRIATYR